MTHDRHEAQNPLAVLKIKAKDPSRTGSRILRNTTCTVRDRVIEGYNHCFWWTRNEPSLFDNRSGQAVVVPWVNNNRGALVVSGLPTPSSEVIGVNSCPVAAGKVLRCVQRERKTQIPSYQSCLWPDPHSPERLCLSRRQVPRGASGPDHIRG